MHWSGATRLGNLSSALCLTRETDEKYSSGNDRATYIALHVCELMQEAQDNLSWKQLKVGYMQLQSINQILSKKKLQYLLWSSRQEGQGETISHTISQTDIFERSHFWDANVWHSWLCLSASLRVLGMKNLLTSTSPDGLSFWTQRACKMARSLLCVGACLHKQHKGVEWTVLSTIAQPPTCESWTAQGDKMYNRAQIEDYCTVSGWTSKMRSKKYIMINLK